MEIGKVYQDGPELPCSSARSLNQRATTGPTLPGRVRQITVCRLGFISEGF